MKGEKKRRLIPYLLMLLAVLGCEDEKESILVVGLQGRTDALRPLLSVKASAPSWRMELDGPEVTSEAADNYSEEFRTPSSGNLRVDAWLKVDVNMYKLAGGLELDLRPDWAWIVDIWLGDENPGETCFGCIGVLAFPVPNRIRPATADSLYLTWSGTSLSNRVIH